jgi:hypothetical protein
MRGLFCSVEIAGKNVPVSYISEFIIEIAYTVSDAVLSAALS